MNAGKTMLAAVAPLPEWVNFLAMAMAILLVGLGALIWLIKFRKKRKRKYRHRRHEEPKHNPTLAEIGGLPPIREANKSTAPSPPP
jgi:hypothetical protein